MKLPSHAAIAGLILMAATQSPLAMELIVGAGETVVLNRDRILGANSSIAATGTLENNARLTNGLEDGMSMLENSGTLNNNDTLENIGRSDILNIGTLNNDGTFNTQDFSSIRNFGILNNTGTLNNETYVSGFGNSQFGVVNNNGTVNNSEGSLISNAGTFNNYGTLNNDGGFSNSVSTVDIDGELVPTPGTLVIAAGSVVTGDGTIGVGGTTGGSLIVNGTVDQSAIGLGGGMLSGDGVINAPVTLNSQFGDAATVAPGNSPGTLTINDDIDFLNGSILSAEIGGLAQGTEYDLLDVFGTATLDASTIIELIGFDGFAPEVGDAFDILQANTLIAGPAFTVNLLNEAALFNWDASVVDIDGGRQALRVTAISTVAVATPVPASLLLLVSGLGGAALLAARRRTVH